MFLQVSHSSRIYCSVLADLAEIISLYHINTKKTASVCEYFPMVLCPDGASVCFKGGQCYLDGSLEEIHPHSGRSPFF